MACEEDQDRLLDQALARLAAPGGDAPSAGFVAAVMRRLDAEAVIVRFRQLLAANPSLRRECASVASRDGLAAWLARTAQRYGLPVTPLLTTAGQHAESANDGELEDDMLDAVVGAGTAGTAYLADFLRNFPH